MRLRAFFPAVLLLILCLTAVDGTFGAPGNTIDSGTGRASEADRASGRVLLVDSPARELWGHFWKICTIPRPSKQEGALREHIRHLAEQRQYPFTQDEAGNALVRIPADKGFERAPTLVFHSHLDMVGSQIPGHKHDFTRDPIEPEIVDGYVTARKTNLGADNGMGVAAMMALMTAPPAGHGPLELLFTVDEEADFTGIIGLKPDFFTGTLFINLDSEEDHQMNIACAGGQTLTLRSEAEKIAVPADYLTLTLELGGLEGGHSGVDIHRQRGNAIKLTARILKHLPGMADLMIGELEGGTMDTAIPQSVRVVAYFPAGQRQEIVQRLEKYYSWIRKEHEVTDPSFTMTWKTTPQSRHDGCRALSREDTARVIGLLSALPNGARCMNKQYSRYVQTSSNVGSVKFEGRDIVVMMHVNSFFSGAWERLTRMVGTIGRRHGFTLKEGDPYPAWTARPDSRLIGIVNTCHQRLFGRPIGIKIVHAGLECGVVANTRPHTDIVSFGPGIEGAHIPGEKVSIASVEDFWKLVTGLISDIAKL